MSNKNIPKNLNNFNYIFLKDNASLFAYKEELVFGYWYDSVAIWYMSLLLWIIKVKNKRIFEN